MESSRIDHITITSPTLEAGAAYVRQALGVEMQPGASPHLVAHIETPHGHRHPSSSPMT